MATYLEKINVLTEDQYKAAKADGSLNENEFYLTPDAPTEAEIQLGTYSTTETRIGTWLNGKPLYRRAMPVTTVAGQKVYDIASWKVEIPVNLYGYVMNNGDQRPVNFAICFTDNGPVYFVSCFYVADTIRLQSHSGYAGFSGYVILEYTKTTD